MLMIDLGFLCRIILGRFVSFWCHSQNVYKEVVKFLEAHLKSFTKSVRLYRTLSFSPATLKAVGFCENIEKRLSVGALS